MVVSCQIFLCDVLDSGICLILLVFVLLVMLVYVKSEDDHYIPSFPHFVSFHERIQENVFDVMYFPNCCNDLIVL